MLNPKIQKQYRQVANLSDLYSYQAHWTIHLSFGTFAPVAVSILCSDTLKACGLWMQTRFVSYPPVMIARSKFGIAIRDSVKRRWWAIGALSHQLPWGTTRLLAAVMTVMYVYGAFVHQRWTKCVRIVNNILLRQKFLQNRNFTFFFFGQVYARFRFGVTENFSGIRAFLDAFLKHLDDGRRLLVRLRLCFLRILQVRQNTLPLVPHTYTQESRAVRILGKTRLLPVLLDKSERRLVQWIGSIRSARLNFLS